MNWHVALWGTGEVHTKLRRTDLIKRDHLKDLSVKERIILK